MQSALLISLPAERPAPNEVDLALERDAHTAVGEEKQGVVVAFDPRSEVGYLQEESTGVLFTLVRKLLDPGAFNALEVGRHVAFKVNRFRSVVQLKA